jgi:hypothetical protein
MPPKRKGTIQATSSLLKEVKVRLKEAKKVPAKDGGAGGKSKPASDKRGKHDVGRNKAPKKGGQIEPLVAETKPVRPSIPSDLDKSIKEIAKRKRLKSPPPPQMPKRGHRTCRKSG